MKSTSITLRLKPHIKEALSKMAKVQHRSITNMVEVLIYDYCELVKIDIEDKKQ